METEKYTKQALSPSPAHLLHTGKQLHSALLQSGGQLQIGWLHLTGTICSDRRRFPPITTASPDLLRCSLSVCLSVCQDHTGSTNQSIWQHETQQLKILLHWQNNVHFGTAWAPMSKTKTLLGCRRDFTSIGHTYLSVYNFLRLLTLIVCLTHRRHPVWRIFREAIAVVQRVVFGADARIRSIHCEGIGRHHNFVWLLS